MIKKGKCKSSRAESPVKTQKKIFTKTHSFIEKLFCATIIMGFVVSCNLSNNGKFMIPVEDIIKLDSTKIGITTIASDLNVPWEIAWGPDDQIWFTEQSGTISKVDPHTGKKKLLLNIVNEVYRQRTLGLLGMAIHPDKNKHFVFIDYTHKRKDSVVVSRLVRYTYTTDTLKDPLVLLEIPASTGHNGSRIAISQDGKIFWATGDAARYNNAQDTSSLNGKVLRLNIDGSIPEDNPFPGNLVWSFGHRNIQGIAFSPDGTLFSSEHGDAIEDEMNIIQKGKNYGWPRVEGYCDTPDEKRFCDSASVVEPIKAWTPTVAPSGIDYYHSDKIPEWNNSILLATLKATSLRVLYTDKGKGETSEKVYFPNFFGRLRDVCVSPAGDIYISTSNRDWNPLGVPKPNDDRIIRLARISDLDNLTKVNNDNIRTETGTASGAESLTAGIEVYTNYCSSCHKKDGGGVPGVFPALRENQHITGDKNLLATIVLKGSAAVPADTKKQYITSEKMPAFNFLNDRQIADVVTYIRQSWGNHADSISNEQVKNLRKKLK